MTDLQRATFKDVEGLLISDMTGEIGFMNIKNVPKLPELQLSIPEQEVLNHIEPKKA